MYTVSPSATTAQILATFNAIAATPRKAFKTKADATQALTEIATPESAADFPEILIPAPTKKPGRRTDLTNATIHTTATPNPARPRTMRHERFNILATLDGKTVEDYYQACRDAGIPCSKNNPVQAVDKGFITLSLDGAPFMAVAA